MRYKITGTDTRGRRFRIFTDNLYHALGINLWRGAVWEIHPDGRTYLVRRVFN